MTRLFKLGFRFFLGLLILWEDSILDFNCEYIWFHSLELISAIFSHFAVARFYHIRCISYLVVISLLTVLVILLHHLFIIFTMLSIIPAKPFPLELSYFFVITCFTFDTNLSLSYHKYKYIYIVSLVLQNIFYICICEYVYVYLRIYVCIYLRIC